MKNIINTIRGHVTEEGIMRFMWGMAGVIIFGMMFISFASIDVDSDVNNSIIDNYIEVLDEGTDDLMTMVVEFNEAYYTAISSN